MSRILPDEPVASLAEWQAHGGGRALERAIALGPDRVLAELDTAGLRGRGGGGFPTGRKWRTVRDTPGTRKFVVVNGAEGEPGTFKDRSILRANPYQVVEGAVIAARSVGARDIYIAVKASFLRECDAVRTAIEEMARANMLDDLDVTVVQGPGEYLFGEEKALLEVIEGNEPLPRVLPPFQHGLFATAPQVGWSATPTEPGEPTRDAANPTLVNNVETLAHVSWIFANDAQEFRGVGTPESPGTTVFTLCEDVNVAGVWELPMGTPLHQLLDDCGHGVARGRVKMVCSGVANPVLPGNRLDATLDYEGMKAAGAGLGSAGLIVYDESACALAVARLFSRFLSVESCGQCPPCKLGSGIITDALLALERRGDATQLAPLQRALTTVTDGNRCFLGAEEQQVVASVLQQFPEDVVAHEEGRCSLRHDLELPLLVDLVEGRFRYDAAQVRKQPDWTYT
jgi:NADH:ubiquinone oxidoreductase subunit F (NADH-binding)